MVNWGLHFSLFVLIFCSVVFGGLLVHYFSGVLSTTNHFKSVNLNSSNFSSGCENYSLVETASCLNYKVRGIFNYTVRPDTVKSYDDILMNGGDCFDYSTLYVRAAGELGFKGEVYDYFLNDEFGHSFAVIYDDSGYCVLDQTIAPSCMGVGGVSVGGV